MTTAQDEMVEKILRQFMKDCENFTWETGLRRKFYGAQDKIIKILSSNEERDLCPICNKKLVLICPNDWEKIRRIATNAIR
jgi:hypothetical protein